METEFPEEIQVYSSSNNSGVEILATKVYLTSGETILK